MSLTISGGAAIGGIIDGLILSYDKKLYESKIDELQGFYNELASHQARLEALRDKLQSFWNDSKADKTRKIMEETVANVESKMEQIQNSIDFYRNAISKFDADKEAMDEKLDAAIDILKNIE